MHYVKKLLCLVCDSNKKASTWFEVEIKKNGAINTLEDLKFRFYKQFLTTDWQMQIFFEMTHLKYKTHETVRSFVDRFQVMVLPNDMEWDNVPEMTYSFDFSSSCSLLQLKGCSTRSKQKILILSER